MKGTEQNSIVVDGVIVGIYNKYADIFRGIQTDWDITKTIIALNQELSNARGILVTGVYREMTYSPHGSPKIKAEKLSDECTVLASILENKIDLDRLLLSSSIVSTIEVDKKHDDTYIRTTAIYREYIEVLLNYTSSHIRSVANDLNASLKESRCYQYQVKYTQSDNMRLSKYTFIIKLYGVCYSILTAISGETLCDEEDRVNESKSVEDKSKEFNIQLHSTHISLDSLSFDEHGLVIVVDDDLVLRMTSGGQIRVGDRVVYGQRIITVI